MAAVAFFYAGALILHIQLLIVVIFLFVGTLAFFSVIFNENSAEDEYDVVERPILQDEAENYQNDSYR